MRLAFLPPAAQDVARALRWYERQRTGLGADFVEELARLLALVAASPSLFPVIHRGTRRALLRRFPYLVFFRVLEDSVIVVAVFHSSRDPRRWADREQT